MRLQSARPTSLRRKGCLVMTHDPQRHRLALVRPGTLSRSVVFTGMPTIDVAQDRLHLSGCCAQAVRSQHVDQHPDAELMGRKLGSNQAQGDAVDAFDGPEHRRRLIFAAAILRDGELDQTLGGVLQSSMATEPHTVFHGCSDGEEGTPVGSSDTDASRPAPGADLITPAWVIRSA